MSIQDILTIIGVNGGVYILIFFIGYFLLNKTLDAKIEALKMKEIEAFKNELSKELVSTKHQLQLEYARKAIIYDKQKDSFNRIIRGMQKIEKAFRDAYNIHNGILWPIDNKVVKELKEVTINESLFIGEEGEYALNILHDVLLRAVT